MFVNLQKHILQQKREMEMQEKTKNTRIYEGLKWKNTNRCIDLPGGQTKAGTKAHLWDCNDSDAQNFIFEPTGEIKVRKDPSKCLDVPFAETKNGAPIQVWDCNNSDAQKFVFENGSIKTKLSNKNFAFDVAGGVNANGTPIQIWTYDPNNNNQKFDTIRKEWTN
jgi:hypothetical protein